MYQLHGVVPFKVTSSQNCVKVYSLSMLNMLPITLAHHPPVINIRSNACPQKSEQLHHHTTASI